MSGAKITRFYGVLPKISSELLPETAAQTARNTKLFSGDLVPYAEPSPAGNTGRTGLTRTLYALRDPQGRNRWLSWTNEVDIAVLTSSDLTDQRFYYTGDNEPKVSNYSLAFSGQEPYPSLSYTLGLPTPAEQISIEVTPPQTLTTASFERDANNIARIKTATPHGLRSGVTATITGFTFREGTFTRSSSLVTCTIPNHGLTGNPTVNVDFVGGDAIGGVYQAVVTGPNTFTVNLPERPDSNGQVRLSLQNFNGMSVPIVVEDETTITYFSPGPQIAETNFTTGRVDLGGVVSSRSYLFSWITPWGEESIGSKPTPDVFIREGTRVTVSGIPTAKPAGNNFVRGVRLYRTLANPVGTEYFRLKTLWFPTALRTVERIDGNSKVRLAFPHNLGVGERVKITGCTDPTFNIIDGVVTDLVDDFMFEYRQPDEDDLPTTQVNAGTLYHDISENPPVTAPRYWGDGGDFDFVDDFDPLNLNDILRTDEYDMPPPGLTGLIAAQNNLLAGFVGNKLYFSEPGRPHAWPAAYEEIFEYDIVGIVPVNGSILVLTKGFPYIVSGRDPAAGMSVQRVDVLYPCLNRRGIVSMNYGVVYPTHDGLAVFAAGGGPDLITRAVFNKDTWESELDPSTIIAEFYKDSYIATHSSGAFVFEPSRETGGQFVNLDLEYTAVWYDPVRGELYYVPGDDGAVVQWDDTTAPPTEMVWKSKTIITPNMVNLGAARIIADFDGEPVYFRMWVDKELLFEDTITDSNVFRMPTGYRSDTFEVEVRTKARVRAIHLGINPTSLRTV